ncbi:hypothetical protein IJ21_17560 [Paenibacillus sp. 32O-W]|nr:hypothetical protein IJ21_17560 [Paenibacillus sp. 32O-W]
MKDHVKRVQFYTRMAARYSADHRPRHERNRYRFARLMRYKAALNARLENARKVSADPDPGPAR